jgi:putative salt-induced outer membrane protein YdiY
MSRCIPAVLLVAVSLGLAAQEPKPAEAVKQPWSDKASLSLVSLSGNAAGQTLGFSNEYKYGWTDASLAFNLGGVRVSTTTTAYSAAGTGTTPGQYSVIETKTTATTAESYFANARYDHKISDAFFWFGGLGWDRNIPAGIDSRSLATAGLGYWWIKTDASKFRTDLGLGYTKITPVLEAPGFQDSYGTWSLTLDYAQKAGATGLFTSNLSATSSLKDANAYLAVWKNGFTTNLGKKLALRVGYDLIYNNSPAYQAVNIIQTGSNPPVVLGQAPVRLKKMDTVFTTSLVMNF